MAVNAVVGNGESTKQAIATSLKDIHNKGDEIAFIFEKPTSDTLDALIDVILEQEYEFNLIHDEDNMPPSLFRKSEHGVCTKVRNPINSALDAVSKDGAVLFLWDDDENDGDDTLIDHVFDRLGDLATVLDLGQGLTPITCEAPVEIPEIEEPEEEEAEEEEVEDFTEDELANMPAAVVKEWGKKKGLEATTKSGILKEAFPEEEEPPPPENVGSAPVNDTELGKALRAAASHLIRAANMLGE